MREDEEDDIPGPARQVRRRIDASPREGTRRSARLASKRPATILHAPSDRVTAPASHASADRVSHDPDQGGRRRSQGHAGNAVNRVDERRVPERTPETVAKSEHDDESSVGSATKTGSSGRALVAGEPNAANTLLSPSERGEGSFSPSSVKKEEDEVDLALLTGFGIERSPSIDSIPFVHETDRDSSESRSSSVESSDLATPEPVGEAGTVRVHHDEESLTMLEIISEGTDEDDQEEFLPPQLPNGGLVSGVGGEDDEDEGEDEDHDEVGERRRSLGPEPEDGLLVEIRLGRIPGLASPERSTAEE